MFFLDVGKSHLLPYILRMWRAFLGKGWASHKNIEV